MITLHPIKIQRIWLHRSPLNVKVVSMKLDDGRIINIGGPSRLFTQRPLARRIFEATGVVITKLAPSQWDEMSVRLANELKFGNEE